jgi:hypothetical protein
MMLLQHLHFNMRAKRDFYDGTLSNVFANQNKGKAFITGLSINLVRWLYQSKGRC